MPWYNLSAWCRQISTHPHDERRFPSIFEISKWLIPWWHKRGRGDTFSLPFEKEIQIHHLQSKLMFTKIPYSLGWCKFIIWSPFSLIFGYVVGGVMTFNNSSLYLSQMHFPARAKTVKIFTDWRIFHSFAFSTLTVVTVVATLLTLRQPSPHPPDTPPGL